MSERNRQLEGEIIQNDLPYIMEKTMSTIITIFFFSFIQLSDCLCVCALSAHITHQPVPPRESAFE